MNKKSKEMFEFINIESINNAFSILTSLLYKPLGFYLGWIILHYVCVHLYANICVPLTFWGFITSPLNAMNPLCRGLEWINHNSLIVMSNMWLGLGTWITTNILYTNYEAMKNSLRQTE
jgi:hypothetical protein